MHEYSVCLSVNVIQINSAQNHIFASHNTPHREMIKYRRRKSYRLQLTDWLNGNRETSGSSIVDRASKAVEPAVVEKSKQEWHVEAVAAIEASVEVRRPSAFDSY